MAVRPAPREDRDRLALVLESMDRVLVIGDEAGIRALRLPTWFGAPGRAALPRHPEVVLLTSPGRPAVAAVEGMPVLGTIPAGAPRGAGDAAATIAWLGRHLCRTKLGLALGASAKRT